MQFQIQGYWLQTCRLYFNTKRLKEQEQKLIGVSNSFGRKSATVQCFMAPLERSMIPDQDRVPAPPPPPPPLDDVSLDASDFALSGVRLRRRSLTTAATETDCTDNQKEWSKLDWDQEQRHGAVKHSDAASSNARPVTSPSQKARASAASYLSTLKVGLPEKMPRRPRKQWTREEENRFEEALMRFGPKVRQS